MNFFCRIYFTLIPPVCLAGLFLYQDNHSLSCANAREVYTLSCAEKIKRDTVLSVNGRIIDIQYPSGKVKGTILCLPGWNFSRTDVCEKSSFCSAAKNEGFILVLPEMGKSIYASALYAETRNDWKHFPQLHFVTDTMIPVLQKNFNLLQRGQNNFIYGISTGGRGTAMIALHTDSLFTAGASLSGDFDQELDKKDNLMIGYYGSYDKYSRRWKLDDPYLSAERIGIPFYLGHGSNDKVVPVIQSKRFYQKLKEIHPGKEYVLHVSENAGHNYDFWAKETQAVLLFFSKHIKY